MHNKCFHQEFKPRLIQDVMKFHAKTIMIKYIDIIRKGFSWYNDALLPLTWAAERMRDPQCSSKHACGPGRAKEMIANGLFK